MSYAPKTLMPFLLDKRFVISHNAELASSVTICAHCLGRRAPRRATILVGIAYLRHDPSPSPGGTVPVCTLCAPEVAVTLREAGDGNSKVWIYYGTVDENTDPESERDTAATPTATIVGEYYDDQVQLTATRKGSWGRISMTGADRIDLTPAELREFATALVGFAADISYDDAMRSR